MENRKKNGDIRSILKIYIHDWTYSIGFKLKKFKFRKYIGKCQCGIRDQELRAGLKIGWMGIRVGVGECELDLPSMLQFSFAYKFLNIKA